MKDEPIQIIFKDSIVGGLIRGDRYKVYYPSRDELLEIEHPDPDSLCSTIGGIVLGSAAEVDDWVDVIRNYVPDPDQYGLCWYDTAAKGWYLMMYKEYRLRLLPLTGNISENIKGVLSCDGDIHIVEAPDRKVKARFKINSIYETPTVWFKLFHDTIYKWGIDCLVASFKKSGNKEGWISISSDFVLPAGKEQSTIKKQPAGKLGYEL